MHLRFSPIRIEVWKQPEQLSRTTLSYGLTLSILTLSHEPVAKPGRDGFARAVGVGLPERSEPEGPQGVERDPPMIAQMLCEMGKSGGTRSCASARGGTIGRRSFLRSLGCDITTSKRLAHTRQVAELIGEPAHADEKLSYPLRDEQLWRMYVSVGRRNLSIFVSGNPACQLTEIDRFRRAIDTLPTGKSRITALNTRKASLFL